MTFKSWTTAETEPQFRQLMAYLFKQDSIGKASTGVLAGYGVAATSPSPSGSVVVGAGAAICQPTTSGGVFPLLQPADETVDVFTTNPMQFVNNPRNDIVIADQVTGATKVLIGTPNVTPSLGEPSVPSTAVPLARLRHLANATTIPGAQMDDLRDDTYLADPAKTSWSSYPVVWSTNGVFPLVGNGTLTGRTKDIGKTRLVHVEFVRGSTTQAGNDNFTFSLPDGNYQSFRVSGSGHYLDASPFTEKPLTVKGIGSNSVALILSGGGRLRFDTIAWAAGDEIVFDVVCELA